ncbi:hypothetical protein [Zooshikella ganghwensis]|uniref:hypothetical protein n=1 Tax=Zooshikella ganghwensis TaxID=202772 RepID=UPI000423E234|nr:hypothetical protein [Zooshikella ganghwensis]
MAHHPWHFIVTATIEIREKETNTVSLFDYVNPLDFLDIKKDTTPTLFWTIIIIQYCMGIGLIISGLKNL